MKNHWYKYLIHILSNEPHVNLFNVRFCIVANRSSEYAYSAEPAAFRDISFVRGLRAFQEDSFRFTTSR